MIENMIVLFLLFINLVVDYGIYFTVLSFILYFYMFISLLLSLFSKISSSEFQILFEKLSVFFKEQFKVFATFIYVQKLADFTIEHILLLQKLFLISVLIFNFLVKNILSYLFWFFYYNFSLVTLIWVLEYS